ncbi:MAG: DUF4832 domain-containing protein [Clostridia bacterium]
MKSGHLLIFCAFMLALFSILPAFGSAAKPEVETYTPAYLDDVLINPYMGLAPDSRSDEYKQPHSLVYANLSWRQLEPEKGNYQFDQVEAELKLAKWADQNMKWVIRVILDYPEEESHKDIPDWLYNELDGDGEWYENSHGKGFSPNYSNPKLIAYHKELITKLGERYKDDPRLAFIELGSIGHWGEWHTNTSIPFPKQEVSDQYVKPYLDSFSDSILLMRRPHPIAKQYKLGLYNDMFANKKHTSEYLSWIQKGYISWLTKEPMPAMPDYWKYAPSGGEFSPSQSLKTYFDPSNMDELLTQAKATHISWMGPNTPAKFDTDSEQQQYLNKFLNTIGYRFSLAKESHAKKVTAGSRLNVSMEWKNSGIAPFYFPWPLELSLADESGKIVLKTNTAENIRKWLPGTTKTTRSLPIPPSLPTGTYTICAAIVDPHTGLPGIQFAMEGKRGDLRYTLGKVSVVPK